MRQPARLIVLLFVALLAGTAWPRWASADARSEAREHYQAGVKAYGAGDYRAAIREFSAAQELVPADLNHYNLALCHDKLGEAELAIQQYREFLRRVPNADKRVEIEASVARLEAALRSAAAKRADEARAAEEARVAEEARKAEAARAAEEARTREQAAGKAPAPTGGAAGAGASATTPGATGASGAPGPASGTAGAGAPGTATGASGASAAGAGSSPASAPPASAPLTGLGSTGTPGSAQNVSTGDAQLDRAAAIDIDAIRRQRLGMSGAAGLAPTGAAPAGPAGVAGPAQGSQGAQGAAGAAAPQGGPPPLDAPKRPTPVYKKWWFWAVVAVSAVVVYQIATVDSAPRTTARLEPPQPAVAPGAGGFALLRF